MAKKKKKKKKKKEFKPFDILNNIDFWLKK